MKFATKSFLLISLIIPIIIYLVLKLDNLSESFYGEIYKKGIIDFSLTDHNGKIFNLSDYKGNIVLINFGYTNCPDVCPTTLVKFREILMELDDEKDNLKALFITVDPERDTVEKLKNYIPHFHSEIIGLTGTMQEIKDVSDLYNVIFFKENEKSDKEYLMSHSPSIYLINKNGELFLKYPQHKISVKGISEDIKLLM